MCIDNKEVDLVPLPTFSENTTWQLVPLSFLEAQGRPHGANTVVVIGDNTVYLPTHNYCYSFRGFGGKVLPHLL